MAHNESYQLIRQWNLEFPGNWNFTLGKGKSRSSIPAKRGSCIPQKIAQHFDNLLDNLAGETRAKSTIA